jgi:perosamine synthetase
MSQRAPLHTHTWPILGPDVRAAVARVVDRGVLSGDGAPEVSQLEREWAAFTGVPHAVATGSGTFALVAALLAAAGDVGPRRREVVVPAYTFGATVCAVLLAGFEPRFVEIEPRTFNLDLDDLQRLDSRRVAAIVPVHLHGLPCDIEPIAAWARARGIVVVEDCAQSHGARYGEHAVGAFGDLGCFSLQSSKHLGAGEGGMVVTHSAELAERVRTIASFGLSRDERAMVHDGCTVFREHVLPGGMLRLQELSAAVARAQLVHLPGRLAAVQAAGAALIDDLQDLPGLHLPPQSPDRTHVFHKFRIGIDVDMLAPGAAPAGVREALRDHLHVAGLETTLWQTPVMPLHRAFERYAGDRDWRRSRSQHALERSFVLFSEDRPLIAQDAAFTSEATARFRFAWDGFMRAIRGPVRIAVS